MDDDDYAAVAALPRATHGGDNINEPLGYAGSPAKSRHMYAAGTALMVVGLTGAVVCALIVIVIAVRRHNKSQFKTDHFWTPYAQEEPTRSYVPYTGTIPYGPWGTKPWAEVATQGDVLRRDGGDAMGLPPL